MKKETPLVVLPFMSSCRESVKAKSYFSSSAVWLGLQNPQRSSAAYRLLNRIPNKSSSRKIYTV